MGRKRRALREASRCSRSVERELAQYNEKPVMRGYNSHSN